jgi:hypothetical protein
MHRALNVFRSRALGALAQRRPEIDGEEGRDRSGDDRDDERQEGE